SHLVILLEQGQREGAGVGLGDGGAIIVLDVLEVAELVGRRERLNAGVGVGGGVVRPAVGHLELIQTIGVGKLVNHGVGIGLGAGRRIDLHAVGHVHQARGIL